MKNNKRGMCQQKLVPPVTQVSLDVGVSIRYSDVIGWDQSEDNKESIYSLKIISPSFFDFLTKGKQTK